jgi:outer membrane protein assembly factor BamE
VPNALIYLFRSTARPAAAAASDSRRALPVRWKLASLGAVLALAGCSSVTNYVPGFIKPYRADIQQGNWLTQSQVEMLRQGMTREQVRFALGTPTLTNIFRADRWDYPYLFIPGHGQTEERVFTVFFVNDKLDRWNGDRQPARQPFQKEDTRRDAGAPAFRPNTAGTAGPESLSQGQTLDGSPTPTGLDPAAPPVAAPVTAPARN